MSSGYTYYTPSSLVDDPATPEHNQLSQASHLTSDTLSNSTSPALNNTQTSEETLEALSHYQFQQLHFANTEDPFFGVNFSSIEDGSPAFLEDDFLQTANNNHFPDRTSSEPVLQTQNALLSASHLPMSPEKTPSLQTSPNPEAGFNQATFPKRAPISVNTQEVTHRPKQPSLSDSQDSSQIGYELTPETTNSAELGDDGSVPSINVMSDQSPRVTVSNWDNINSYTLDNAQSHHLYPGANGNDFANQTPDGNMSQSSTLARDGSVRWASDQGTDRTGVAPDARSSAEVRSVNELAAEKQVEERNEEVDAWMAKLKTVGRTGSGFVDVNQPALRPLDHDDEDIDPREIPRDIGMEPSENKRIPGQTYFLEKGGEMTAEDRAIIYGNRNWADAPLSFPITSERHQPETSQDAIRRFQQMCKDNGSIISRAATWGTRRRSIGTIDGEVEKAGNFLQKLSLSRGDSLRRPSFMQELRGLVRRPSNAKRTRAENEEDASNSARSSVDRKESQGSLNLAPPGRTGSLGKKQSVPSINTALFAVANNAISVGAGHARNGSISNTPITSPSTKSPARNLSVNISTRFRSRSDASARKEPGNGLATLLKSYGGPPAPIPNPAAEPKPSAEVIEIDDSEEEDDDEDAGDSTDSGASILKYEPTDEGFRKHFLELHPELPPTSGYLVDRVVYQQKVRYKQLLNLKRDHEERLMNKNCPSGSMCIKAGGKAKMLKTGPNNKGFVERPEDDMPPGDKMINPNQFPANIPPPITRDLPADLECQLCFQAKRFAKPSDWTKHVHEDVSPFACTWEHCKDNNKTFKRKADWVRHENEGHRRIEWWKCIVDDCNHECYRRDNFLQHLVREHKFDEPKDKTKGAIRKAGGARHRTWQMVERCYNKTEKTPFQEPCRFCGEKLATWKKLTVHLAKHMEQISLPIIKLVERTDVDPDTIISPVQEPAPRHYPPPVPPQSNDRRHSGQPHMQQRFDPAIPGMTHMPMRQMPMTYPNTQQQHPGFGYQPFPQPGYQSFGDLPQNMMASASMNMTMGQQPMNQAYHNLITTQPAYTTMPMTTTAGGYMTSPLSASQMGVSSQLTTPLMGTPLMGAPPPNQFMGMSPDGTGTTEAFPGMDLNMNMNALGLQDPSSASAAMGYGTLNSGGGGGGGLMLDTTSLTPTPSQGGGSRPHSQNGGHHSRQHSHGHGHVNAQFMPMGPQGPQGSHGSHGNVSPFGNSPLPGQGGFYQP